jgi:hypothetical protein
VQSDDGGNGAAEFLSDFVQSFCAALIFCGIMQQGRDRLSSVPPCSTTRAATAIKCEM